MEGHAFGEAIGEIECFVKGVRKKMEPGFIAGMDPVDVIGPIDQHAAPDHDKKHREVDPVHPSDGEGMFGNDFFHVMPLRPPKITINRRWRMSESAIDILCHYTQGAEGETYYLFILKMQICHSEKIRPWTPSKQN